MEKKWWILVVLVIGIVAVFIAISELSKPKVQRIQGGVVISAPGEQFPGSSKEDPSGEPSDFVMDSPIGPVPETETYGCWQCPADGTIINLEDLGISLEDLTDAMVSNITNCTNKTQLVQVDCPVECNDLIDNDGDLLFDYPSDLGCTSETDDSEDNCGNGLCEEDETMDSCPGDCVVAPVDGGSDLEEDSGAGGSDLEEDSGAGESESEDSPQGGGSGDGEDPGMQFHTRVTYNGECVMIFGPGPLECSLSGDEDFAPQLSVGEDKSESDYPRSISFLERLFAKMFGFRSD